MSNRLRFISILSILCGLLLSVAAAAAQTDALDPLADPNFGGVALRSGFLPDPYIRTMTSGGNVDLSALNLATECRGFATASPDFRFEWSGRSSLLRLFFVGLGDTTLAVLTPSGEFICNDDYADLNPMVDLPEPTDGIYNVWVGSFASDQFIPGYLFLTEGLSTPDRIQSPLLGLEESENTALDLDAVVIDPESEATFGTASLQPGFTPDPFEADLTSGGRVDVATQGLGVGCVGFVASAPDYTLNLTGDMPALRMFFVGDGDTTLVLRGPDGTYYCNDDSFDTRHPTIDLTNAAAGQYDVWVGSFSSSQLVSGTLYVTEVATVTPRDAEAGTLGK